MRLAMRSTPFALLAHDNGGSGRQNVLIVLVYIARFGGESVHSMVVAPLASLAVYECGGAGQHIARIDRGDILELLFAMQDAPHVDADVGQAGARLSCGPVAKERR